MGEREGFGADLGVGELIGAAGLGGFRKAALGGFWGGGWDWGWGGSCMGEREGFGADLEELGGGRVWGGRFGRGFRKAALGFWGGGWGWE